MRVDFHLLIVFVFYCVVNCSAFWPTVVFKRALEIKFGLDLDWTSFILSCISI